jgi:hypothetical protein
MLQSYPFVPVVGSVRIVVAIFSYDGGLYFGVTGDYDGAPDIDVLTKGIRSSMDGLLARLPSSSQARGRSGRKGAAKKQPKRSTKAGAGASA